MALNLQLEDKFGNGGISYWKVIEINRNVVNNSAHVTLAGYVDKEARDLSKQPVETRSFDWSGENYPFTLEELNKEGVNAISVAYAKIKESKLNEKGEETNWFVDSINC